MNHGITKETEGLDGIEWNVVGHTYIPKLHTENAMIWYAEMPPETFVPPHIHPTQDEWISMLSGTLEVEFGGEVHVAKPGDLIRMPMGVAHGIFNRSGDVVKCTFGVAPSRKLFALFNALHNVTDPAELVRISAEHEVDFLPPPDA